MSLGYQPMMSEHVMDLIWNKSTDAVFALDYDGAVIDANPTFKQMLGWEMEELDGIAFPPFILDMTKEEHQTLIKHCNI